MLLINFLKNLLQVILNLAYKLFCNAPKTCQIVPCKLSESTHINNTANSCPAKRCVLQLPCKHWLRTKQNSCRKSRLWSTVRSSTFPITLHAWKFLHVLWGWNTLLELTHIWRHCKKHKVLLTILPDGGVLWFLPNFPFTSLTKTKDPVTPLSLGASRLHNPWILGLELQEQQLFAFEKSK